MLHSLFRWLRYDWPLYFVLLLSNWLPDNIVFLRLRGWLAHFFLGSCGENFRLGRNVSIYNPSKVYLGSDVYFAYGSWIAAGEKILIDDQVMLGPYSVIVSDNHTKENQSYRFSPSKKLPIHVGSGSWMAAHSVLTAGVDLGKGCLIAANSVVLKGKYCDESVIGGVPVF